MRVRHGGEGRILTPYIADYCVISFLFMLITIVFYTRQRKIRNFRYRLYGCLVVLGMLSLAFDFLAAVMEPYNLTHPVWLVYLVNVMVLFCVQLSGPCFMTYTLVLTGIYPKCKRWQRLLLWLPFAVVAVLLLLVPVLQQNSIFYVNDKHAYARGAVYPLLYFCIAFYILASLLAVVVTRAQIRKVKRYSIYGFMFITLLAMGIQFNNPHLLINTTANALALTMIFHSLEEPREHIDPLTHVFNREALMVLLNDLYEQNQPYSIAVFSLESFHLVNRALGIQRGDTILISFAQWLEKAFSRKQVVRLTGDMFLVLDVRVSTPLTKEKLQDKLEIMPKRWYADGMETPLPVTVVGINGWEYPTLREATEILEYIIGCHESRQEMPLVCMADEEFRRGRQRTALYEAALESALLEDRVRVFYQPIHASDGRLVALEALCRITDPVLGPMRPDIFIPIAEKNGTIYQLDERVLEQVCAFIKESGAEKWGLEHIGVNLSALQCVESALPQIILKTVDRYNVDHSLIGFEITETQEASSLSMVRTNMQLLREAGFSFLLDDFGSGYANFNYILELPFSTIKIDHDILWTAVKDEQQMAFLRGIESITKRLGLKTLCEGVETIEQAQMLRELGVDMQQGYFYSKAIPQNELIVYAKAHGMEGGVCGM